MSIVNPQRGEVSLPPVAVPGFEKGGTLLLDFNALCSLEAQIGDVESMGPEALQSPMKMRQVFQAALLDHHGDVDDRAVGKIIQALGIGPAGDLMLKAFELSFPEATANGAGDPPPGAKTGGTSPAAMKSGPRSGTTPKRSGDKRRASSPAS